MKSRAKSKLIQFRRAEGVELDRPMCGIALSGGGSHGAFSAGLIHRVFSALLERRTLPRLGIVSGTSTGALVGGLLVQMYGRFKAGNQPEQALAELEYLYTRTTQGEVGEKPEKPWWVGLNLLRKHGVMDISPLRRLIGRYYEPEHVAAAAAGPDPIPYSCNFIDMVSGQQRHFASDDRDVPGGASAAPRMTDAMFASCAQPVVMTPAYVDGHWATDGGVREVIPLREVMGRHCTHALAVALNEPELDHERAGFNQADKPDPLKMIERGIVVMNDEVARDDERLARFSAHLNRAKDRLRLAGVAPEVIEAAFSSELLIDDVDQAPGCQDPMEDSLYNCSRLRELLLFRFERERLESSDKFDPVELRRMFDMGVAKAEQHLPRIVETLFVGGALGGGPAPVF